MQIEGTRTLTLSWQLFGADAPLTRQGLEADVPPTSIIVSRSPVRGEEKEVATERVIGSFAEALRSMLGEVERADAYASEMKRRLLVGESVELHEVLLATEKAHLAFQTLLAVRNKLLEAYQELTRMPL